MNKIKEIEKAFVSILPFGIDEVIETFYCNGEMIQITRKRTEDDKKLDKHIWLAVT